MISVPAALGLCRVQLKAEAPKPMLLQSSGRVGEAFECGQNASAVILYVAG